MRWLLIFLLVGGSLWANPLDSLDREICCLELKVTSLEARARQNVATAERIWWWHVTDARQLYHTACLQRRRAHELCCRVQRLRQVRAAFLAEIEGEALDS